MEQHHISQAYEIAAETIKNAILQGQYVLTGFSLSYFLHL